MVMTRYCTIGGHAQDDVPIGGRFCRMSPTDGFRWITCRWGRALQSTALVEVADHLFTTRQLRLRGPRERDEWAAVADALGVEPSKLLRPRQVHGRGVLSHRRGETIPAWDGDGPDADIIATDDPVVAICVQVADCIPMLLADRRTGAVAAAHAGWRGCVARVAEAAVGAMVRLFGARPADLVVAFGPSIGACCYEVGPEVREAFLAGGFDSDSVGRWFVPGGPPSGAKASGTREADDGFGGDRLHLDLWTATRDQLAAIGVVADHIHLSRLCTVDHLDTFFSYRAEGPGTGRIVGAIRARR